MPRPLHQLNPTRTCIVKRTIAGYAATLIAFLVIDAVWLASVAVDMFRQSLGPILRDQPNMGAALAFYLIYASGLYALAVRPGVTCATWTTAARNGGILGLTAYATFDLTNLAIISGWTVGLAISDIAWGTAVSTIAAVAGYATEARMARPESAGIEGHGS
jgi:uncharacterized membrane protein